MFIDYFISYEGENRFRIERWENGRKIQFPVANSHLTIEVEGIRLIGHQIGGAIGINASNIIVDRCTNWLGLTDIVGKAVDPMPCKIIKWGVDSEVVDEAPRVLA